MGELWQCQAGHTRTSPSEDTCPGSCSQALDEGVPQRRSLFNQQELAGKRQEVQQGRREFNKATARS